MVIKKSKDGSDVITFVPEDTKKISESLGDVVDWSLNAMLAAGINPNMPIHTGYNTRLDGFGDLSAAIDSVSALDKDKDKEDSNN